MNLKNLSNVDLHKLTLSAVEKERHSTVEVLWHLRENEKRMLYAEMGYRDLKEYCVKCLKYSEGSAWRRISAMRLLKELPEMENKIQSGSLNLTQIAMARTHFSELKSSLVEKKEILSNLENQSTRITERILAEHKPEGFVPKPEVIEKPIRGQKLEVTLILDESLQKELEEIQIHLGKSYSKLELLKLLASEKLASLKKELLKSEKTRLKESGIDKKIRKMQANQVENGKLADAVKNTDSNQAKLNVQLSCDAQPAPSGTRLIHKRSRYISRSTIREIKIRDQHQCQYVDQLTKRQCTARYHLQNEHVFPFAKGGASTARNLQTLCANHNRFRAVQEFGASKMNAFIPSLR